MSDILRKFLGIKMRALIPFEETDDYDDENDDCISSQDLIDVMMYFRHLSKVAREQRYLAESKKKSKTLYIEQAKEDAYYHAFETIQQLLKDNGIHVEV